MGRINPLIALGIPTWGKVSITWARAYRHLGGPLGSTCVELEPVVGKPIAEARNTLMQQAIACGAEFLYMHGDDVLAPSNMLSAMLTRFRNDPSLTLLTGVYWSREWPTSPYLWRDMQRGPYLDWKVGELVQVDFAGCDALMIRLTDEIKALGPDWFSTTWLWEPEQAAPSDIATEDFYFYTRCREKGITLWADTGLQCIHEDRNSGAQFGLTSDMPQAGGILPALPGPAVDGALVQIADIGCGLDTPFWGDATRVKITRIDGNEAVRPDLRADVRQIPVPDGAFDLVHSRHTLEHFGRAEVVPLLTEWIRILRVGGELRLNVPNALFAMENLLAMDRGEIAPNPYPSWQMYGRQDDERDLHKNWFTPRRLRLLLEMPAFGLTDIQVSETDDRNSINAVAVKASVPKRYALTPAWDEIAMREGLALNGMREPDDWASLSADVVTTKDILTVGAKLGAEAAPSDTAGSSPAVVPSSRAVLAGPTAGTDPGETSHGDC